MKRRNNRGIAAWLKWLLIIMVAGTVLLLATCGIIGYMGYNMVSKAMDPVASKELAGTMVTINELPPNYKYAMGMDLFGACTIVCIEDSSVKMYYMLMKLPAKEKLTAEQMIDQAAAEGVPTATPGGGQGTAKMEVKTKGKTTVGGVEMPYIVGIAENSQGTRNPAFLGCVCPNDSTNILILAMHTGQDATEINVDQVKQFLAQITSFKK